MPAGVITISSTEVRMQKTNKGIGESSCLVPCHIEIRSSSMSCPYHLQIMRLPLILLTLPYVGRILDNLHRRGKSASAFLMNKYLHLSNLINALRSNRFSSVQILRNHAAVFDCRVPLASSNFPFTTSTFQKPTRNIDIFPSLRRRSASLRAKLQSQCNGGRGHLLGFKDKIAS